MPPPFAPLRLGALLLVLFSAACATARSGAAPTPAPVLPSELRASSDAERIAAWSLAACRGAAPAEKAGCYTPLLLALLPEPGVATAMDVAERLAERDADARRDGHVLAHVVGRAAFTTPDAVGAAFSSCTPAFQSGCYHGVIQSYFVAMQHDGHAGHLDSAAVNDLCAPYRGEKGDDWLLFQCAHGMGHGFVMLYDHDLPRGLEGCDAVADAWERESCYGGAFMENVVNAIAPHDMPHDAGGHGAHHAAADAHAGDHGAEHTHAAGTEPFRALDPDDLHYPCSIVGERYQIACYGMQTSVVLHHNGYDFAATGRFCATAPERMHDECYNSLGRDVASFSQRDAAKSVRLCSLIDAAQQPWCYTGVVRNIVDVTADARAGLAYCPHVPAGENRARCYTAVGMQTLFLTRDAAEREALCASAEPEYTAACRRGARLSPASAAAAPSGEER
jgi:hypothetical protein